MANRYANLVGSNKIKDEYQKINTGFDKVQQEMDEKPDNSFAKINDVEAEGEDAVTIEAGTGITITTTPEEKKIRITATGEATPGPHGSEHNHDGADPIPDLVQLRDDLNDIKTPVMTHLDEKAQDDVHSLLSDGKIIEESGSNANGQYVRFADGTQICWNGVVFQDVDGSVITYNWVNPAQFLGPVRYFGTIHSVTSSNSVALNRRLARNQNGYVIDPGGETQTINLYTLSIGRWK